MARLIVSMNTSLDGYIEGPGEDDGSWLRIDEEVHRAFNDLAASADVLLYGRKVFEVMPPYWPDAAEDATRPAHEHAYGRIWVDKPKVVISSTLEENRWNTRVVAADAVAEARSLKAATSGYVLCYGGSQLIDALQTAGLVDEYQLYAHPTALGGGAPLFRSRTELDLVEVKRFALGVVRQTLVPRTG